MNLETKIVNTNFDELLTKMGYTYFRNGSYNLNIIGIRSNARKNNNIFDDFIVVEYRNSDGNLCSHRFHCTTNPGRYYLNHPCSHDGCAILVPGQYRGAYEIGFHKGLYKALVQRKPLKVYRDNNRNNDLDLDPNTIVEGIFGINIHKAGVNSIQVDKWSAGCQVFQNSNEFDAFMAICTLQINSNMGHTFTYTLIDEKDLDLA